MSEWDQFKPAAAASPAPLEWDQFKPVSGAVRDMAKSGAVGVGEGVISLAGMGGDIRELEKLALNKTGIADATRSAARSVGSFFGASPEISDRGYDLATGALDKAASAIMPWRQGPTSQQITQGVEGVTGEFYKSQTPEGKVARSVGQFLPGALIPGGGGIAARTLSAIGGGVGSEVARQATEGSKLEPYAQVAGGVFGALMPSGIARAITPNAISAERQVFVDTLRNEGVPLTAGQTTGREGLRYAESSLGNAPLAGGRAAATMENQAEAFTRAALRRVGEDAPRATPEVIDGAFTRIGGQFEALAQRNSLPASPRLGNDLVRVEGEYNNLVSVANRAPVVANTIRDIGDEIARGGGRLSGEQYNAITSRLARQARGAGNDPQLREALHGIRNSLDDAMERSLFASGNSADFAAWREARNQYRNLMVIERAATGAGENAAQGLISPSQLRNATVAQNRRGYARGQGDFADLARAGEATMKPLPQSGTAPRAAAMAVPSVLGAGIGSLFGGPAGAGLGAFIGSAAAGTAPGLTGRALMSAPMQAYLRNQLIAPPPINMSRAVAQSLLSSGSALRLQQQ